MNDLNFFGAILAEKRKRAFRAQSVAALIVLTGFVLASLYGNLVVTAMEYRASIEMRESLMQQREAALREYDELSQTLQNKQSYLTFLGEYPYDNHVTATLAHIGQCLPETMRTNSIAISETDVSIQSVAEDKTSIAAFIQNLKNTGLFETVGVSGINAGAGGYSTTVNCRYKGA